MPFVFLLLMTAISAFAGSRDNLVYMRQDFCTCKDGKSVSYGNCASFCSGKNTNGAELLFANFSIVQNKKYKDVYEWCSKASVWDFRNPKCEMSFKDEEGKVTNVDVVVKGNSVIADVTGIHYDKTFVFHLTETVSKAKSNFSQMIKFDPITYYPLPLQAGSITKYSCLSRTENKKFHFYFHPQVSPTAQNPGSAFFCHDWLRYGETDNETYPRFEEVQNAIAMWPQHNPLFYDNDGNGYLDVNDAIRQHTKKFGGTIPAGSQFFQYFTLPGDVELYAQSGTNKNSYSYVMPAWIDQTTFYSYCPSEAHYNSSNPLWKALGEVVGVPTEGLYAGVESEDGRDVILLRETDIKSVWFFLKNNQVKVPNDETVSRVTVYFYYPLDKMDPYTRKPHQKVYRVKSAQELGVEIPAPTTYPTHDRKLACIPKI